MGQRTAAPRPRPRPGPPTPRHSVTVCSRGGSPRTPPTRQLRGRTQGDVQGEGRLFSPGGCGRSPALEGARPGRQLGPRACPRPEKPALPGGPQPGSEGPGSAEARPRRGSRATRHRPDVQRGETRTPGHARARPDPPRGARASSARGPGRWTAPTRFGPLEGPGWALGGDLGASVRVEGDVTKPPRASRESYAPRPPRPTRSATPGSATPGSATPACRCSEGPARPGNAPVPGRERPAQRREAERAAPSGTDPGSVNYRPPRGEEKPRRLTRTGTRKPGKWEAPAAPRAEPHEGWRGAQCPGGLRSLAGEGAGGRWDVAGRRGSHSCPAAFTLGRPKWRV